MPGSDNAHKQWIGHNSRLAPLLGRNAMLLLLAWVGGSADAVSYLGLGHIFTANMTGNTIVLGIAVGQGQLATELRAFLSLLGFCIGAGVGALIIEWNDTREDWPVIVTRTLSIEGVLLAGFACIWYLTNPARSSTITNILVVISALAMGLQSAAVLHLGISGVTTTYVSGTWTEFAMKLVERFIPPKKATTTEASTGRKQSRLTLQFAVLVIYALAAVVTGLGAIHWPKIAPFLPLLIVIIVIVNATTRLHGSNQHGRNQSLP